MKCTKMPGMLVEISDLHKFNLEFQKYHKADRDTILRSERAATDSYIKNTDLQHFGQWVFIYSHFFSKKWPVRKHGQTVQHSVTLS